MGRGPRGRPALARVRLAGAGLWAVAALLAGCAGEGETPAPAGEALHCYVGGTMRPAMEELVRLYGQETGRGVDLDYGDSGSNLIKAETSRRGDLYVAHDPFHGAMVRKGLADQGWIVATLEPVIVVAKGNPKGIAGLKDLVRPGVRLALTDALYSTMGHVVRVMVRKAGLEAQIEKNVVTRTRMGGEAANAVILGHADAAMVWNAVAFLRREKLDAVAVEPDVRPDPKVDAVTTASFGFIDLSRILVTIDVLKSSRQPEAARAFAEFAASSRADEVWSRYGFGPAPQERRLPAEAAPPPAAAEAAARPAADPAAKGGGTVFLYVGAGLRTAMDDVARAFTARTGIAVECDYGGSGMLISRLRLAQRGDLFMPGDQWYVDLAEQEGLVASKTPVGYFVPVLLVRKGNPLGLRDVADLARPGVRLGLGNPKACQVGRASEAILRKNAVDPAAIEKNLVFSSVTVNELGLQVRTGQLDAAIVWDAVAAQYADSADAVPIPAEKNEVSRVTIALLKGAANEAGARQFIDFLVGPEGRALFRKHQYRTDPPE